MVPGSLHKFQASAIHKFELQEQCAWKFLLLPTLSTNFSISICQVNKEVAVKMYGNMVTLQIMDTIFYEAQRQGRISFYLTSIGEEAINIASAAALTIDDLIFPQVTRTNKIK